MSQYFEWGFLALILTQIEFYSHEQSYIGIDSPRWEMQLYAQISYVKITAHIRFHADANKAIWRLK